MRGEHERSESRTGEDGRADEDLVNAVRHNDREAFGELYIRYYEPAYRFACLLLGSRQGADDLVSEAFAKVLARIVGGGGPTTAFRGYLMAVVRTTLYKQLAAEKSVDRNADLSDLSLTAPLDDPVINRFESSLASNALHSLPKRWRSVLQWLEVEERTTQCVGEMLGIGSNAVWALAFRAREALRIAYLQQHVNMDVHLEKRCQEVVPNLAAWVCGRLSQGLRKRFNQHINSCQRCADAAVELSDLVDEMWRLGPHRHPVQAGATRPPRPAFASPQ